MNRSTRRAVAVAAAVLVGTVTLAPGAPADTTPSVVLARHQCGPLDRPEPGLQGDVPRAEQDANRALGGYNCGLALVGHTGLDSPERDASNLNMAWAGDCAYVAGMGANPTDPQAAGKEPPQTSGVAVVDVRNPRQPWHVRTLRTPGALGTAEALHAVETPERSILVVGQYGNDTWERENAYGELPEPKPMSVYDVSRCDEPRLLETFVFPENIHNLTLSGDGRYAFGTMPLQVVDLAPLYDADPATTARFLGNLEDAITGPAVSPGPLADHDDAVPWPTNSRVLSHEAWPSSDGHTLHLGSQMPGWNIFSIVDISAWLQRDADDRPAGPPRIISQRSGRGHSIRTATIGARRFALHSEESVVGAAYGCLSEDLNPLAGAAEPWLTDITDPADPHRVSQFGLAINQPQNCAAQLDSKVNASTHYHDFDRAVDARFAMVSMWNAGVRVFDVRNPAQPAEVGYFNPGDVDPGPTTSLDVAAGHVRYVERTGHIWFATMHGGFWVVEIEKGLRRHLGVAGGRPLQHPDGRPAAAAGATLPAVLVPTDQVLASYCTLATARSSA